MREMKSSSPAYVAIVIPIYNVGRYLTETLESVLAQTYPYIRVYAVNDGSTDCSCEILDKFARQDQRISVFHKENAGVSSARNVGISELEKDSSIKYVCFIDGDDKIDSKHCETFVQAMEKTCADYAVCSFKVFTRFGIRNPRNSKPAIERIMNQKEIAEQYFHVSIDHPSESLPKDSAVSIFHANRFYRASAIRGLRFDESLTNCEDRDFLIRAIPHFNKGIIVPDVLFYYRKRGSSLSNTAIAKHNDFLVFERFYKERFKFSDFIRVGIENDFIGYLYQELYAVLSQVGDSRQKYDCYVMALRYINEFTFEMTPGSQKKVRRIQRGFLYNRSYAFIRHLLTQIRFLFRKIKYFP